MKSAGALAVVLAVTALASCNALHGRLLLDDYDIAARNPHLESPGEWPKLFDPAARPPRLATFRPVRELSFALDCWAWGRNAWGMHASSLALYLLAVAAFWALGREVGLGRAAACAAAAWFGLHAAHSETLGWVKNRGELLAGLFGLLCLRAFLRPGRLAGAASAACLVLALGCMETAATYAAAAMVAALWAARGRERSLRARAAGLALVGLAAVWLQARVLSDAGRPNAPKLAAPAGLGQAAELAGRYSRILLAPARVGVDAACGRGAGVLEFAAAALVVGLALAHLRRGGRAVAAGLLAASLGLLSLVVVRDRPVAEHRLFAATAGAALCLGFLAQPRRARRVRGALALLAACAMAALFIHRNFLWGEDSRVWRNIVVESPDLPKGRINLAFTYLWSRRPRAAAAQLRAGLKTYPACERLVNDNPPEAAFRETLRRLNVILARPRPH